jgi:alpha-L-rhamnosidase
MSGLAASAWKFDEGQNSFEVTIPANTTATVYLPFDDINKVESDGKLISGADEFAIHVDEQKNQYLKFGSGTFKFSAISP